MVSFTTRSLHPRKRILVHTEQEAGSAPVSIRSRNLEEEEEEISCLFRKSKADISVVQPVA